MKHKVFDIDDLERAAPIFKGKWGRRLGQFFLHLCSIDRVNQVYDRSFAYKGAGFSAHLLRDVGAEYRVGNAEKLQHLPDGAFITISNHPYGGLDGIMLIDLIAGIRGDYKFMVNKLLSMVETLNGNFIAVKTVTTKKPDVSANLNALRETFEQLKNGHPVGFFPSGAVSDFCLSEMKVRDREWQESVLKLIKKAKVPIIPIRFFDRNSPFFYFLGLINWRIRLIRMSYEVFNKRKQQPRIAIGNLISVEEQEQYPDIKSFGQFLRSAVYDMPEPDRYVSRKQMVKKYIAPAL